MVLHKHKMVDAILLIEGGKYTREYLEQLSYSTYDETAPLNTIYNRLRWKGTTPYDRALLLIEKKAIKQTEIPFIYSSHSQSHSASQSKGITAAYEVNTRTQDCTCPNHQKGGKFCYHLIAAYIMAGLDLPVTIKSIKKEKQYGAYDPVFDGAMF